MFPFDSSSVYWDSIMLEGVSLFRQTEGLMHFYVYVVGSSRVEFHTLRGGVLIGSSFEWGSS